MKVFLFSRGVIQKPISHQKESHSTKMNFCDFCDFLYISANYIYITSLSCNPTQTKQNLRKKNNQKVLAFVS